MNCPAAFLAPIFLLFLAVPAFSQSAAPAAKAQVQARAAAIKRCRENRGSDCESAEGLKEWLRQDQPITPEQRQTAASVRRHREECARNGKSAVC